MLNPDEQRAAASAVERSLASALQNVAEANRRGLDSSQKRILGQIRNFIQQARERQQQDIVAAKSLAERAEILSRELVNQLRGK